jgi:hypothetical protein
MVRTTTAKDPMVLSYLALRKAVGGIALSLPFVMAIPWWVLGDHILQSSISAYYYTGMRDLFVGSLCAISMFMLGCRGFDRKDEIAGTFAAACALGVAFFPTPPDSGATKQQQDIGYAHYTFALLLFLTLCYFCLVLFKMSARDGTVTPKKLQRNVVYTICGWVIFASIVLIAALKYFHVTYLLGGVGATFCFETTALFAFGIAWLVKGETFLKDDNPTPPRTVTTDGHVMIG